jgi:hypothetical protein
MLIVAATMADAAAENPANDANGVEGASIALVSAFVPGIEGIGLFLLASLDSSIKPPSDEFSMNRG